MRGGLIFERGKGMRVPDYNQVWVKTDIWSGQYKQWVIVPGGFMIAITIQHLGEFPVSPEPYLRARFHLYAHGEDRKFRTITWPRPMANCGIAFETPVLNVNSAHTFRLEREYPDTCPDLEINVLYATEKF